MRRRPFQNRGLESPPQGAGQAGAAPGSLGGGGEAWRWLQEGLHTMRGLHHASELGQGQPGGKRGQEIALQWGSGLSPASFPRSHQFTKSDNLCLWLGAQGHTRNTVASIMRGHRVSTPSHHPCRPCTMGSWVPGRWDGLNNTGMTAESQPTLPSRLFAGARHRVSAYHHFLGPWTPSLPPQLSLGACNPQVPQA